MLLQYTLKTSNFDVLSDFWHINNISIYLIIKTSISNVFVTCKVKILYKYNSIGICKYWYKINVYMNNYSYMQFYIWINNHMNNCSYEQIFT